jgi:hypothetical protein
MTINLPLLSPKESPQNTEGPDHGFRGAIEQLSIPWVDTLCHRKALALAILKGLEGGIRGVRSSGKGTHISLVGSEAIKSLADNFFFSALTHFILLYKLTRFQLKAGDSRCCHKGHVEKNCKVNAFHWESVLSGSFLVVGSFFENLVIIKMSVAGRYLLLPPCCPGPVCSDSSPPWASAQNRAEKGQGTLKGGGGQRLLTEAWSCNAWCVAVIALKSLKLFLSLSFLSLSTDPRQVCSQNICSCFAILKWPQNLPWKVH